ncbi:unnamed protein product [Phaedon cochleariae]|uniref:Lamin-B receptor n=1 Tax=Phaedon cochleariae TaxID=80249 RepID=A0A9P0DMQ7_PHACE|nr:unnamed protein product [Phaedon cochleariae]
MVGKAKPSAKTSASIAEAAGQDERPKSPSRQKSSSRLKSPNSPSKTKIPTRQRSPTKQRSPARQKSPGRQRSPARQSPSRQSPARTKPEPVRPQTPTRTSTRVRSPARLRTASPSLQTSTPIQMPSKRSPIRGSPARGASKEPSVDKEREIPTKKQIIIIDTESDSDNPEIVPEVKEKPKATVRGRTRGTDGILEPEEMDLKRVTNDETSSYLIRRFTRSSQNRDVEKVVHLKHFDSVTVTKRLGEFSDEDDIHEKKPQSKPTSQTPIEFLGPYGALFSILAMPVAVLALYALCNESRCSFDLPDLNKYRALDVFFDVKSCLGLLAYIVLLAIFSAVPTGGSKISGLPNKHGKLDYILNGLFAFSLILSVVCALELRNVGVFSYVVKHLFHLLFGSVLLGLVVSIGVYLKSFYVPVSALNAHAVGRGGVYGFFMGQEVNPRWFSVVDVKVLFFRASVIGSILIDFAFLYQSLSHRWTSAQDPENSAAFDPKFLTTQPTLFVLVLLRTIYFTDSLIFESTWITSFTNRQEGFGYLLAMSYCLAPFFYALPVKFVVENGVELASWKLAVVSLVFAFGYLLYRASNNQKNAFRNNPYSPAMSHLVTIPTTQGRKLVASGFWGIVRHPNYLGDILMHLSLVPFVLLTPPLLVGLLTVLILVHRTGRDNARCQRKYGAAWERYCNRVRYALVPKVY